MNYNQWDEVTLSEVTDKIGDGLHGTPKYDDLGEYFFVNGNNLNGKITIDNLTKRVSHSEYLKYKKDLNNTTILLSINGTLGKLAFYNGERVILGKSACYINVKNEVHKKFIYYTLQSTQFLSYLGSHSSGTTIKNLGLKEIRNFSFGLPNYITQKAIANILLSLDDKIELNNKINKNLEELAQTLYKRWFVDFEFPNENGEPYKSSGGEMVDSELGMIPKGWEVKELSQIADLVGGFAFKGNSNDEFGKYGVITIKNVQNGYLDLSNLSKTNIFPEKLKKTQMLEIGDLLVSLTGNVGRVAIVSRKYLLLNQRVEKVIPKDERRRGLIYFLLRSSEMFNKMLSLSKGSAQQNLSPVELSKVKIVFSNSQDINVFADFFHLIINNQMENIRLIKLRDELLPKLMSGEIEVPVEE